MHQLPLSFRLPRSDFESETSDRLHEIIRINSSVLALWKSNTIREYRCVGRISFTTIISPEHAIQPGDGAILFTWHREANCQQISIVTFSRKVFIQSFSIFRRMPISSRNVFLSTDGGEEKKYKGLELANRLSSRCATSKFVSTGGRKSFLDRLTGWKRADRPGDRGGNAKRF